MAKVISSYKAEWVEWFEAIADYLGNHLSSYNKIEHVGSTSIPGMDAKPIIDIDIEIETEADFDKLKAELEWIGYIHCGDQGIQGREAFKRDGNQKTPLDEVAHHLYVCTKDNLEYKRHLLFRDRLRSNVRLREEYKAIKHEILKKVGDENRQEYVEEKENNYKHFFEKVLKSKP